jgi:protein-disulfide isomerase
MKGVLPMLYSKIFSYLRRKLSMKTPALIVIPAVISIGMAIPAAAQTGTANSHQVKAESVTISMPEGMTKDQADEVLKELKAIHQLLERQQTAVVEPQAVPTTNIVKMSVATGSYSLGHENALVTMVEFADYQCPFCRKFHSDTFAELKKNYIDTGKLRFISRDLPLDIHANAYSAAVAARCAGEQGRFWQMRDAMFRSDDLTSASLLRYGRQITLDMTAFGTCLKGKKYIPVIQKDVADAGALGITGTPSFVVGKTVKDELEGVRIVGAVPYSVFDTTIKDQLKTAN